MAVSDLYMTCTGISSAIREVTLTESMAQAAVTADIICTEHSLSIGDTVTLDLGYADNHAVFLTDAIVKSITYRRPEHNYLISVADQLVKAVDYFIASDDPDAPLTVSNIKAEDLIDTLLALAGLTNYTGESTIFTYATQAPAKINLVTVWQMVETIARVCGGTVYCDSAGQIHFTTRKPYIGGSDTAEHTFTVGASGDIEAISFLKSDEWLRNRVVVYGLNSLGIKATASASSPYLPGGFYKTLVVAHELIDTVAEAQRTADINLTMFNRLTETVTLQALGKPSIRARDIVAVTEVFTGLSAAEFVVFAAEHSLGPSGYSMNLTLTR